jgi:prefoldin subunit 5
MTDQQFQELMSQLKILDTKIKFLEMDLAEANRKLDTLEMALTTTVPSRTQRVEKM